MHGAALAARAAKGSARSRLMSKSPKEAGRKQKTRWLAAYRVFWNSGGRASGTGQLYEIDSTKSGRDASAAAARVMDTSCEVRSCFIEVSYVWPSAPVLTWQQFEGTETNTAIAIEQRARCADTATLEARHKSCREGQFHCLQRESFDRILRGVAQAHRYSH